MLFDLLVVVAELEAQRLHTLLSVICLFHLSNCYFSNTPKRHLDKKHLDLNNQIKVQNKKRNILFAQKCQYELAHSL